MIFISIFIIYLFVFFLYLLYTKKAVYALQPKFTWKMKSGMDQLGLFVEVGENTHETTVPLNKNSLNITEH